MAKVTVTLEDDPISGLVKVVCDPPGKLLIKKRKSGQAAPAEGLGIIVLGAIAESHMKSAYDERKIILPFDERYQEVKE